MHRRPILHSYSKHFIGCVTAKFRELVSETLEDHNNSRDHQGDSSSGGCHRRRSTATRRRVACGSVQRFVPYSKCTYSHNHCLQLWHKSWRKCIYLICCLLFFGFAFLSGFKTCPSVRHQPLRQYTIISTLNISQYCFQPFRTNFGKLDAIFILHEVRLYASLL